MDEGQSADGNEDIHQIKLSKTSKSNRRNTKVMSKDNTPDIISMTLELGAARYIVNAFCNENFRDIWKYALEAKKNKLFIDSLSAAGEEQETSTDLLQTKKKCSKRKSCDYSQDEGEFEINKKFSKIITTPLHLNNSKLPFTLVITKTLSFTTFLFCL
ncbi:hypothetical protein MTR_6g089050 [Medicago truncatula]|uniref:Uncharacterized protein n=1 Tax=Medicago truncatula TaxID=3880 RepID=G7KPY6_MEDTR|nr:hypothetical protein MTR_6g089050 [Medicago truncatula]